MGYRGVKDRSVLCKTELGLAPLVGDDHKCIYDPQSSWIPWEWRLWCLKQHHAWMLSFLPSALPPSQLPSSSHAITPGGVSFTNTRTWTKTAVTYRLDPLPHASEVHPWTKTVADVGVLPPFFTDRWHIPISLIASLLSCSWFQGAVGSWRPSGWRFHDGECASPAPRKPGVGNGASDHVAVVKPMSLASGNLPWWAVMLKLGPRGPWTSWQKPGWDSPVLQLSTFLEIKTFPPLLCCWSLLLAVFRTECFSLDYLRESATFCTNRKIITCKLQNTSLCKRSSVIEDRTA